MGEIYTDVLIESSNRVRNRWQNALQEIRAASYGPEQWVRDVFGFWLDDIADAWMDLSVQTTTVLVTTNNQKSRKVKVPDTNNAKLTSLGQLGGSKTITLNLVKPGMGANSPAAGTVRVDVPPGGFQGPNPPASGEQFVGLLYDDQKPLARVVYLEL
jgi:hypothetical protein